jgi:hypothetical protein
MTKKDAIAKVVKKRINGKNGLEYIIKTKGGKTFCFTITEEYVLIHCMTDLKDITFVEGLNARIYSYNIDASIYQVDIN